MNREEKLKKIIEEIKNDEENKKYTEQGIDPLFSAPKEARIVIVGQAPGIKAQENKLYWKDKSGDKLRVWTGIDEKTFYSSNLLAIIPMDFYYPGKGKNGDLPPRKDFGDKWHNKILELLPNIELFILIGKYAQGFYLKGKLKDNLTDTVKAYKEYLPKFFPIVHPSPLNIRWLKKNPWFEEEVVPTLKEMVKMGLFLGVLLIPIANILKILIAKRILRARKVLRKHRVKVLVSKFHLYEAY